MNKWNLTIHEHLNESTRHEYRETVIRNVNQITKAETETEHELHSPMYKKVTVIYNK